MMPGEMSPEVFKVAATQIHSKHQSASPGGCPPPADEISMSKLLRTKFEARGYDMLDHENWVREDEHSDSDVGSLTTSTATSSSTAAAAVSTIPH